MKLSRRSLKRKKAYLHPAGTLVSSNPSVTCRTDRLNHNERWDLSCRYKSSNMAPSPPFPSTTVRQNTHVDLKVIFRFPSRNDSIKHIFGQEVIDGGGSGGSGTKKGASRAHINRSALVEHPRWREVLSESQESLYTWFRDLILIYWATHQGMMNRLWSLLLAVLNTFKIKIARLNKTGVLSTLFYVNSF